MRAVWVLPLVGGPVLASCAFLLDFDSLQSGGPDASVGGSKTGGTGGTAGTGGAAGTSSGGTGLGGADSGIACTEADAALCDDNDPCTVDKCVVGDSGTGQCISVGELTEDGTEVIYPVPNVVRVTATGGNNRFYAGLYFNVPGAYAQVSSIQATATPLDVENTYDFQLLSGPGEAGPRSAPGLVTANGGLTAFIAYEGAFGGWKVKQVEFGPDLTGTPVDTDVCSAGDFLGPFAFDPYRIPEAFLEPVSKQPAAVWIGPQGIWFGNKTTKPGQRAIPGNPEGVAPLLSNDHAGAIWRDGKTTYAGIVGGPSKPVNCDQNAASFGPASAGFGRFTLTATQRYYLAPPSTKVEWSAFFCEGLECGQASDCSGKDGTTDGAELPGITAFTRPGAPTGFDRIYFMSAVPFTDALLVSGTYTELSRTGVTFQRFGAYGTPTGIPKLSGATRLERPAIAFADDRLFVIWIERAALTSDAGAKVDAIRMKRFKFCK